MQSLTRRSFAQAAGAAALLARTRDRGGAVLSDRRRLLLARITRRHAAHAHVDRLARARALLMASPIVLLKIKSLPYFRQDR